MGQLFQEFSLAGDCLVNDVDRGESGQGMCIERKFDHLAMRMSDATAAFHLRGAKSLSLLMRGPGVQRSKGRNDVREQTMRRSLRSVGSLCWCGVGLT